MVHGGAIPGGGDSHSSVVVGFLREVEALLCSAAAGSVFREGEAYIALPSPYSFRRVEATVALCCRLGTRRNIGCLEVKGWFGFCSCRLGETGDTLDEIFEEDKPLRGSSPTREAFRSGEDQVEAVCDACRSEGVDASTCSATCFLDALSPAGVVRI
ncbi:hypothetical protein HID58_026158 [Brassica napus]|uniref:Uncharacterized protein n=1 Tax=Brassica napus TaxID=3708 RepID=A0ABQ8CN68_BRANA|nr:hypothetical protein HID58_026158 [Brassica napus]